MIILKLKENSTKLKLVAFICGANVMILEIVGSRLIAPYVGTSIFVWTSLISVVLASLGFGYWYGGKKSDNLPQVKMLSKILLFASLALFFLTAATTSIFNLIHWLKLESKWEALLLSIFIFSVPSALLGMSVPFCIRLYIKSVESSGKTVGNIYAISTAGSIFGAFSSGFFLIPVLGTNSILFSCFLSLFGLSIYLHVKIIGKIENILVFIFIVIYFIWSQNKKKDYIQIDSQYGTIFIIDTIDNQNNRPVRLLYNNKSLFSGNYLDGEREYNFTYFKTFREAMDLTPQINDILMLGGAGCSFANSLSEKYPLATIDIVEIDPAMQDIAYKYFFLDSSNRINITTKDARIFLNENDKTYDVILMDVFQDLRIPHHLCTTEFFEKNAEHLNEDGFLIINIIGTVQSKYTGSIVRTLQSVFPVVNIIPLDDNYMNLQNIVIIAQNGDKKICWRKKIKSLIPLSNEKIKTINENSSVFTDNFSPVEYIINQ